MRCTCWQHRDTSGAVDLYCHLEVWRVAVCTLALYRGGIVAACIYRPFSVTGAWPGRGRHHHGVLAVARQLSPPVVVVTLRPRRASKALCLRLVASFEPFLYRQIISSCLHVESLSRHVTHPSPRALWPRTA